MSLTLLEIFDLHAGNLECKICGSIACTTDMKCRVCSTIDKFIDSSLDDILEDLGSLVTTAIPAKDFIESAMKPKATSMSSKRLLYVLSKVSEALEERRS